MSFEMTITRATSAELDLVLEDYWEAWGQVWEVRYIAPWILCELAECYVAKRNGEICGYLMLVKAKGFLHLLDFGVAKRDEVRDVISAWIEFAQGIADELGHGTLSILLFEYWEEERQERQFFQELGFYDAPRLRIPMGKDRYESVGRMTRPVLKESVGSLLTSESSVSSANNLAVGE